MTTPITGEGAERGGAIGTPLYADILKFNSGDDERSALMREIWNATPWVINVFSGRTMSDRYNEIMKTIRDTFGRQASVIHKIDGEWQVGGATVNGWTWIGFRTEAQMKAFQDAFKDWEHADD